MSAGCPSPHLLAVALVTRALAADATAVTVSPGDGCPSRAAITANLDRLAARSPLEQLGSAEVIIQESALHVSFRDPRGGSLGNRTVTTSQDCAERATLAAAVIATFAGSWAADEVD